MRVPLRPRLELAGGGVLTPKIDLHVRSRGPRKRLPDGCLQNDRAGVRQTFALS